MDAADIKIYASSDFLFFYGSNDLAEECASDLYQILFQPSRSMFFYRDFGAGISAHENYPSGISREILIPFAIADSVAKRNTIVGDGTNGTVDRRIATSQSVISVESDNSGNTDIVVNYFLYADQKDFQTLSFPVGV